MSLPPGWLLHPENPIYGYNPTTQEVKLLTELSAPAAVVAPAGGDAVPWGTQDMGQAEQDRQNAKQTFTREDNYFWLDFPDMKGLAEVTLLMRFFPPWSPELTQAYVESFRHRYPARFVSDAGDRTSWYTDCFNMPGGPQNCPICRVIENDLSSSGAPGAAKFVTEAKKKKSAYWQGVNLNDPQSHMQTIKDPATGVDTLQVVPGVLRASPTLHAAILACFRVGLDFTGPKTGFPIECIRKVGSNPKKGAMNIDYDATHHAHSAGPIPADLWPALFNAVNLRERCIYFGGSDPEKSAAYLEKIEATAQAMLAEYGGGPVQVQVPGAAPVGFVPHPTAPGYLYDPRTNQVIPAPVAPVVVPPPPPAPAALPPPAPVVTTAFPGTPVVPGVPPAAAFPAAAPVVPPAPAAAVPAIPAVALPPAGAPGLPVGAAPAVPPPPTPGALPAGTAPMAPAVLEAEMAAPAGPVPGVPGAPPAPPAAPPVPPPLKDDGTPF